MAAKTKTNHYCSAEFRHVSISACGQKLRGPFLRATLPMTVGSCAWAMANNGETKGLIIPPSRCVSAQLLYDCVTAWHRSRRCSQNLCSPFLRAVRLFTLINYITRHNFSPLPEVQLHYITLYYAAQFFPYPEFQHNLSPTRSVTLRGTIFPLPRV